MSKEDFLTIIDKELDRLYKDLRESEHLVTFYENVGDPKAESEKRKIVFIKERIRKLTEIINLPLYTRIQNMTEEEVKKYKADKLSQYSRELQLVTQEMSDAQAELDKLNSDRDALMSKVKAGAKIEEVQAEYRRIEEKSKELLDKIKQLESKKVSIEYNIRVYSSASVEYIKGELLRKLQSSKKLAEKLEEKKDDREEHRIIGELTSEEQAAEFAKRTSEYAQSKVDYNQAKNRYYESHMYEDVTVSVPYILRELGLESFRYYKNDGTMSQPIMSESWWSKNEVDEYKADFERMKRDVEPKLSLLYAIIDGDSWTFEGVVQQLSRLKSGNDSYTQLFARKIEYIRELRKEKQRLDKKLIKSRNVKDSISDYKRAIDNQTEAFYEEVKKALIADIKLSSERLMPNFFRSSAYYTPRLDSKERIEEFRKRVGELDKAFEEVYTQIHAIEEKRDKEIHYEKEKVEQKRRDVEETVGRSVTQGELGERFGNSPYSRFESDTIERISPTYAKFKQTQEMSRVEEESKKQPEFDITELDKLIQERNKAEREKEEEAKTL